MASANGIDLRESSSDDDAPQDRPQEGDDTSMSSTSFPELLKALHLKPEDFKNIPGAQRRNVLQMHEYDLNSRQRLQHVTGVLMRHVCQIICPPDPDGLLHATANNVLTNSSANEGTLAENLFEAADALPKNSVHTDVLLAPMAYTYPNEVMKKKYKVGKVKAASLRRKFIVMKEGQCLQPPARTIKRYDIATLKAAVAFILNDDNCLKISWGTKTFMVNGEEIVLPKLIRKQIVRYMYNSYVANNPTGRIGAESFRKVTKALTTMDQRTKRAVDYVSGVLINDNFMRIRSVLDTSEDAMNLHKIASAVEACVKTVMEKHDCDVTHPSFAFSRRTSEKKTCDVCSLPQRALEYFKGAVNENHHAILNDATDKLLLYWGHRVRVRNQRSRIDAIMDSLASHEGMIVMDFKMKFESVYFREKTTEFYGKKGLSWHGALLYTRYTHEEQTSAAIRQEMAPSGSRDKHDLLDYHITYFDHISSGDSKQDHVAVWAYFDAVLRKMRECLPHVKAIYVQSDNARCYKKGTLLLGMYKTAKAYGIKILSYVHTGVQDGKGSIDAHFSTAMRHVHRYCSMGNDVITSAQLVNALKANGGVANSYVEMIGINRSHARKFEAENASITRMLDGCGEHMETLFNYEEEVALVYKYSGWGEPQRIPLTATTTVCTTNDPNVEDELASNSEDENEANADDDAVYDDDFTEDIDVNELARGAVSKCIVYGTEHRVPRTQRLSKAKITALDETAGGSNSDSEDPLKCDMCGRSFTTTANKRSHKCKKAVGQNDMVSRSIMLAKAMFDQHQFEVINATTDSAVLQVLQPINNVSDDDKTYEFTGGWACHRLHGRKYGMKYIEPFKKDIDEMFNAGNENESMKKGPGRMLAELARRYPGRLDLPSEFEIRQRITSLMNKKKAGQSIVPGCRTRGIVQPYMDTVISIFNENREIAPKAAWEKFTYVHPVPTDVAIGNYPGEKQVRAKISSLKSAWKKSQSGVT